MEAWELAENGALPLVTYRCIESGRGTILGASFTDEGRPVFAWWGPATTEFAAARWFGSDALDDPGERVEGEGDTVPLWCRWHGFWIVPRSVLLDHWNQARVRRPFTVKLDSRNPWYRRAD